MPYRGPDSQRIQRQITENQFSHVGQVVTWRQYISASASTSVAGFDSTPYYRQETITALFGRDSTFPTLAEIQTPAGTIESGTFLAVTRQPLGLRDELVWNDQTLRVESEAIATNLANMWVSKVKVGRG